MGLRGGRGCAQAWLMLRMVGLVFLIVLAGPTVARASDQAADQACDLALVLAVDVSGSVDPQEYRIQMDGLAAGLRDWQVRTALVEAKARLALVQWSGTSRQELSIPWTVITEDAAVEQFAAAVEAAPRPWLNYSTAIGEMLAVALPLFAQVPECTRRVVDVSGDGKSNEGRDPAHLKAALSFANVTVNAIAIEASEVDLAAYFFEHVIHGVGAFVVYAATFEVYPEQIRRKLLREVVKQTASFSP